jgi:transcriptional regulator with XRE-family HTH domain
MLGPRPLVRLAGDAYDGECLAGQPATQALAVPTAASNTLTVVEPRDTRTRVESRLAAARLARGVTQEELARVVGISRSSYIRLEKKRLKTTAPLGWYVNCAIALGYSLEDILDDDLYEWRAYDQRHPPLADWVEQVRERRAS